eukprot:gb/GEZN01003321.1/.p1 GENE.gb/GEZN01003321.1/~~gb/GEZN01003321.1/.p1  ORF type:complete len:567 (-),score=102.32 gb/GEZN01003321.1/:413-2113(-)
MEINALRLFKAVSTGTVEAVRDLIPLINVDAINERGDNALMMAARRGELPIVDILMKAKSNVHHRNKKGSSPLIAASMRGHTEVCRRFLTAGSNVNEETSSKDTALSLAVWKNHTDTCLLLMDAGAQVVRVDKFGDTMLLDAAKHGNVVVMKRLIERSVPIDHANKKGDTALTRASWKGELGAVRLLLDHGADMGHINLARCTALITACMHDQRNCAKELILRGSPLDVKDANGKTALLYLAEHKGPTLFWEGIELIVRRLSQLEKAAYRILIQAAALNMFSVSQALLEKGANVNYVESVSGLSALIVCVKSQRGDTLKYLRLLVAHGADLDHQDKRGYTALMEGASLDLPEVCRFLLEKGASVFVENQKAETALQIALQKPSHRCISILMAASSNLNPGVLLLHAAQNGSLDEIRGIIAPQTETQHAAVDIRDSSNSTNVEGVTPTIVDINYADKNGRTALMVAARAGHLDCLKLLLDLGADIHHKDKDGVTALVWAIRKNQQKCAEFLATAPSSTRASTSGVEEFKATCQFLTEFSSRLQQAFDIDPKEDVPEQSDVTPFPVTN